MYDATNIEGPQASRILTAVTSIFLNRGTIFMRNPQISAMLRGFKKLRPGTARIRKPWSFYHNHLFRRYILRPNDITSMASAAAIIGLGWGGLMRPGEIGKATHSPLLTRGQISFFYKGRHVSSNLTTILITLYRSKTNKGRRPDKIHISCLCHKHFCGHQVICPAHVLERYIIMRDRAFPHRRGSQEPLLLKEDGRYVSARNLTSWLRSAIRRINHRTGYQLTAAHYSGHSLRLGGCTDRARNGDPGHMIETLGRWASLTWKQVYIDLDWDDLIILSGKSARELQMMAPNPFTVTASRNY